MWEHLKAIGSELMAGLSYWGATMVPTPVKEKQPEKPSK